MQKNPDLIHLPQDRSLTREYAKDNLEPLLAKMKSFSDVKGAYYKSRQDIELDKPLSYPTDLMMTSCGFAVYQQKNLLFAMILDKTAEFGPGADNKINSPSAFLVIDEGKRGRLSFSELVMIETHTRDEGGNFNGMVLAFSNINELIGKDFSPVFNRDLVRRSSGELSAAGFLWAKLNIAEATEGLPA